MRVVALVSGGKDSCYCMMKCVAAGHEIVALANLQPAPKVDELDSYMFQTVGHEGIHLYAEAMELPLYQKTTHGLSVTKEVTYNPQVGDEVEDLYELLKRVKEEVVGGVEGVTSGAILSDYQRTRVENVCGRLGLMSLAYLWRRNQKDLLEEMIDSEVKAVVIKVAAMGLTERHLGLTIEDLYPEICTLSTKYGLNVCGEGGEYETFTLDCPLFKKKIILCSSKVIVHSNDAFAPVAFLKMTKFELQEKDIPESEIKSAICKLRRLQVSDAKEELMMRKPTLSVHDGVQYLHHPPYNLREEEEWHFSLLECILFCVAIGGSVTLKETVQTLVSDQRGLLSSPMQCMATSSGGVVVVWNGDSTIPSVWNQTEAVFASIGIRLEKLGRSWTDVVLVYLYLADMDSYAEVNQVYAKHFTANPPARVCVCVGLPEGVHLQVEMLVASDPRVADEVEGVVSGRSSMHVQSHSEWAPANIGPYSQAFTVGEVVICAGQIGLDPCHMTLVPPTLQAALSLTHAQSVLAACHASLTSALCGTCYFTTEEAGWRARKALMERGAEMALECPVQFVCVPGLPRGASVEWHFMAAKTSTNITYYTRQKYEERLGVLLTLQESWCPELAVGAWLVTATAPPATTWHSEGDEGSLKHHLSCCFQQMASQLSQHGLSFQRLTLLRVCVPRYGIDQNLNYSDVRKCMSSYSCGSDNVAKTCSSIGSSIGSCEEKSVSVEDVAVLVTQSEEYWNHNASVSVLALRILL